MAIGSISSTLSTTLWKSSKYSHLLAISTRHLLQSIFGDLGTHRIVATLLPSLSKTNQRSFQTAVGDCSRHCHPSGALRGFSLRGLASTQDRANQSTDTTPRSFETLVETDIAQAFYLWVVPYLGVVRFPVEVDGDWESLLYLPPSRVSSALSTCRPHNAQEVCPCVNFKGHERMLDSKNSARVQCRGHDGRGECAFLGAIDELYYHMSESLWSFQKRERPSSLD